MKRTKKIPLTLLAIVMVALAIPALFSEKASAVTLYWPVPGHTTLSQGFHDNQAIDISDGSIAGANIIAALGGTVTHKYTCSEQHATSLHNCDGFGTGIVISGSDGRRYQYAHMQAGSIPSNVYVGAYVSAGQLIGRVGATGAATGNHLHFGITANASFWIGSGINPWYESYNYEENYVTIRYCSNYADKSFSNPLNSVGSSKNVVVRESKFYSNTYYQWGLHNYNYESADNYLGRTGYSSTDYWNTKTDGTGKRIQEDEAFYGKDLAKKLGYDLSLGNVIINIYPEWKENYVTIRYYSNFADKSFSNPLNSVGSSKNVVVRESKFYYNTYYQYGLHNYNYDSADNYLGRTGYSSTDYWNTKTDGSGKRIQEDDPFYGRNLAEKLGYSISSSSVTINVYPEWISYTLTFNANGGSGAPASMTGNGNLTIPSTKPTRADCIFKGWTSKGATSTYIDYKPGDIIHLDKDVTLYAVWVSYTLTFNANGGSGVPASIVGTNNKTIPNTIPLRDGYTFKGWTSKSATSTYIDYKPGDIIHLDKDVTLYAVWEVNKTDIVKFEELNFNGHTYQFYKSKLSWNDAKKYAESLGGHLMTITTFEEQVLVEKVVNQNKPIPVFWLGATDSRKEGSWEWITGEPFTYSNWSLGEPNDDYSGEDYMGTDYLGATWNDWSNDTSQITGFIVEFDYINTPTTPDKPQDNPTKKCTCNCHKKGIENFFFKIGLFFQRIFGQNKTCKCGVKHY